MMYTSQQAALAVTSIVFTILGSAIVTLRIFTRSYVVHNIGWDDAMMALAMFITVAYLALLLVCVQSFGMGQHGTNLKPEGMVGILKATFAIEIIYYCTVFAVKSSITLLYLRLAAVKTFRYLCYGTLVFLVLALTSSVIVTSLQCIPLRKSWDITGTVQAKCINSTAFFYTTSGYNIVLDIWLLALPVKTLMSIQRPNREKFVLLGVFLLGAFSCIASIVRLYTIRIFTASNDPFFDGVPVNMWSMIELNVAMICASIPCLKPLISKSTRTRMTTAHSSRYRKYAQGSDNVSWPNDFKGEQLPSPTIELAQRQHSLGSARPIVTSHSETFLEDADEDQPPVLGGIQRGVNVSQFSEAGSHTDLSSQQYPSFTTRIDAGSPLRTV